MKKHFHKLLRSAFSASDASHGPLEERDFEGEGLVFVGKFYGRYALQEPRGESQADRVFLLAKHNAKKKHETHVFGVSKVVRASISLTLDGVMVHDKETKSLLATNPVKRMCAFYQDHDDSEMIGINVKGDGGNTGKQGAYSCLVFRTPNAGELLLALKRLSEIVFQKLKRSRRTSTSSLSHADSDTVDIPRERLASTDSNQMPGIGRTMSASASTSSLMPPSVQAARGRSISLVHIHDATNNDGTAKGSSLRLAEQAREETEASPSRSDSRRASDSDDPDSGLTFSVGRRMRSRRSATELDTVPGDVAEEPEDMADLTQLTHRLSETNPFNDVSNEPADVFEESVDDPHTDRRESFNMFLRSISSPST